MNTHAPLPSAHVTGADPGADRAVLSARALVYSYGNTPALRGVSVQVGAGEILAITGPSGSGKSTLMLCLSGVLRPDAGEVRFGDHVISNGSESDRSKLRRSDFGILFQFGQLVPELRPPRTSRSHCSCPALSGMQRSRPQQCGSIGSVSPTRRHRDRWRCRVARRNARQLHVRW